MPVSQTMLADVEAHYHRILNDTGYSVDGHEDVALKSLILLFCKGSADDVERSICGCHDGRQACWTAKNEAVELRRVVHDLAKEYKI